MIKTCNKLGIEGNYFNMVQVIHEKPTTDILSCEKLKAPPPRWGTRQGSPPHFYSTQGYKPRPEHPARAIGCVLPSHPQCDGIWRRGLWEVIRSWEGRAFTNGISALRKKTPESSLAPSVMWEHKKKTATYEPKRRPSLPYTITAGAFILDFSGFRTVRNKFLLLISSPV